MQLGVSSYAFGWAIGVKGYPPPVPMDELGVLAFARAHGLRVVQLGDHLPLAMYDASRVARLAQAAAGPAGPPLSIEIGARGLTETRLAGYLSLARTLSSPVVRFIIDEPGYEPSPDEVVALLRAALPEIQAARTVVGLENHDRFPARALRRIVERINSECVGICLDTANSLGVGEGLGHVVDQLGPHTVNLHVKDFAIVRVPHAMGFTVEGRPSGAGMLDVAWLRDALASRGRCHSALLETWATPGPTLAATLEREHEWAGQSIGYLKTIFGPR